MEADAKIISTRNGPITFVADSMELFEGRDTQDVLDPSGNGDRGQAEITPDRRRDHAFTAHPATMLVINVTNSCNSNCVYCYEKEWRTSERLLEWTGPDLLEDVARILHSNRSIRAIKFFGGEPLLFPHLIDATCKSVEEYCQSLGLKTPQFSVVTNGTIYTSKIVEMLKRHRIRVTISIDGPPAVNRLTRPPAPGNEIGLASDSEANIRRLSLDLEKQIRIEATFTKYHAELGIGLADILKYCSRFSQWPVDVLPAQNFDPERTRDWELSHEDRVRFFGDGIRYSMSQLGTAVDTPIVMASAIGMISTLLRKERCDAFCPASGGQIALVPGGYTYPCYLFLGHGCVMSRNADDNNEMGTQGVAGSDFLSKTEIEACRHCWASPFCKKCLFYSLIKYGSLSPVHREDCDFTRAMSEEFLRDWYMLRISSNEDHNLCKNLSKLGLVKVDEDR